MNSFDAHSRGRNVSISWRYNFAWFRVAKTGTRSLNALLKTEIDDYRYFERGTPFPTEVVDFLKHDCFRFSMVRNPWDRLVSAWRNKLQHGRMHQANIIAALRETATEKEIDSAVTEFPKFVGLLPDSHLSRNIHFKPQEEILSGIELDFVGRFECYTAEIEYILSEVGLKHLASSIPRRNQTYDGVHYSNYYDEESRNIVGDLFQADITRWDYSFETVN